ncbi:MAG: type III-B CRISPR module-associated protein Cmr3 [Chloroflexi bacterium]|nr:type III-B CRISPR module-associated protein Cmr3 [Chloroflexota bacterium]
MELFLEPIDVWLFRDGKPFDALSDHRARSLFPPYPTVMQGVIRSHHLVVKGVDLRNPAAIAEAVGTTEYFGNFRLRGPFIAKKESDKIVRYFPVPADVVLDKQAEVYCPLRPRPREEAPYVLTNAPTELPMLLWQPEGFEPRKRQLGQWLVEEELFKCLHGQLARAVPGETLFARESRFGIGRDDATRTTREGVLYEVEFIRPCPGVGLWVQVDGYNGWPDAGLMRIGGEGRGAHFTRIEPTLGWPQVPAPLPARFKVYFASPTYFEEGWKPKDWGCFFDGTVTLQAIALNRYESIGGFDWADIEQKPARRYVPAGSVYYFTHDGSARLKPGLINNAITNCWPEIGFGQVIITEW